MSSYVYVSSLALKPIANGCRDGNASDCYTLAHYLLSGASYQGDGHLVGALESLERSCDLNSPLGCRLLGDLSPKFRWWAYQRACILGNGEGCLKYSLKPSVVQTPASSDATDELISIANSSDSMIRKNTSNTSTTSTSTTSSRSVLNDDTLMQPFVLRPSGAPFESSFFNARTLATLSDTPPLAASSQGTASALLMLASHCFASPTIGNETPVHLSRSLQQANDCSILAALPTIDSSVRTAAFYQATSLLNRLCTSRCETPTDQQEDPNLVPVCALLARNLLALQSSSNNSSKNTTHHQEITSTTPEQVLQNGCNVGEYASCEELANQIIGPHILPILTEATSPSIGNMQQLEPHRPYPNFIDVATSIEYLERSCKLDPRGCITLARAREFLAQDAADTQANNIGNFIKAQDAYARACAKAADRTSCRRTAMLSKVKPDTK